MVPPRPFALYGPLPGPMAAPQRLRTAPGIRRLAARIHYRIATGPHAGNKALTLRTLPPATTGDKPYTAHEAGFSINAATVCQEHEREKLEHLCRYVARPPLSNDRLCVNVCSCGAGDDRGQVVYKLKHAFRDGTTHVVMDPLAFIARLAALVPRARANLTRYHGVFAPNFKHRKLIVPKHSPSRHRDPDKPTAPLILRGPPGCSGSNGSSRSIRSRPDRAMPSLWRDAARHRLHRRSQGHSDHPRSHRTARRGFRRTATRAANNFQRQRRSAPLLITPSAR